MSKLTCQTFTTFLLVSLGGVSFGWSQEPGPSLTIGQARVCVVGARHNRPEHFPGLGDFLGWPGGIARLSDGAWLLTHSAGYWHSSFAMPRRIEPALAKRWRASGWPLDFEAPTGGRTMLVRSSDRGRSWSRPRTIADHRLDDGPHAIVQCRDGSVVCLIGIQASWYGYAAAPVGFEGDIDGLNTQQAVIRSEDGGKTWSDPQPLKSPGDFYERAHGGKPIELKSGALLWATYFQRKGEEYLRGAIRRSDDFGKSWTVVGTVERETANVDEPAIASLKSGRLILVTRPDSAIFYSQDEGRTWQESDARIVPPGESKFKAPQLVVMADGTLVAIATWKNLRVWISSDEGRSWSADIPLDTSSYGYPGSFVLCPDQSIVVPYCASGSAPNRVYVVRFRVNELRDGIRLLPFQR